MPESFRKLQKQRLKHPGDNRDMVNVLALVLQHDERKLEQAITTALTSGSPSKQHVISCLGKPRPALLKRVLNSRW